MDQQTLDHRTDLKLMSSGLMAAGLPGIVGCSPQDSGPAKTTGGGAVRYPELVPETDRVFDRIEEICSWGIRRAAYPAGRRAEAYVLQEFEALGLKKVRKEPVPLINFPTAPFYLSGPLDTPDKIHKPSLESVTRATIRILQDTTGVSAAEMRERRRTESSSIDAMKHLAPILVFLTAPLLASMIHATETSPAATDRPNVVLIVADDLGFGDIGAGSSNRIKTPNLDQLARSGMTLTSFYSSANVCTPSRAGILTGRFAIRAGLAWKVLAPNDSRGLPAEETTISSQMKEAGYKTAAIGKWHLGDQPEFHPFRHGFDHFFGVKYSNDMLPFALFDGEEEIEVPVDQSTLTARYTANAVDFIKKNADNPFFLYLPHTFPHIPLHVSDKSAGRSAASLYGDVVEEIDWSTGEIIATLRELGILDNTLVVFTSDNGPWFEGSTGAARGRKGSPWGGGYRVPLIASWPGHIPAATVSGEMGMNIDLLPTITEAAQIDLPEDHELDGRSLLPVLSGKGETSHEYLFFFNNEDVVAIRDRKWKLVTHGYYRKLYIAFDRAGPKHGHPGPYFLLFDMEDPEPERYSLARDNPEVVDRLYAEMKRAQAEFGQMRTHASESVPE